MKRHIIDEICGFDMHPAFEGYECPFLHDGLASCEERGCPIFFKNEYDEEIETGRRIPPSPIKNNIKQRKRKRPRKNLNPPVEDISENDLTEE